VTFMEDASIMSSVWTWAVLLFSVGFCLLGVSAVVYVAFRFLSLALSMEVGILREFKTQNSGVRQILTQTPAAEATLKDFVKSRFAATEGDFQAYNDEEAFIQERVEDLRRQGMTQEELDAFVRQAVGTDIGKPENEG